MRRSRKSRTVVVRVQGTDCGRRRSLRRRCCRCGDIGWLSRRRHQRRHHPSLCRNVWRACAKSGLLCAQQRRSRNGIVQTSAQHQQSGDRCDERRKARKTNGSTLQAAGGDKRSVSVGGESEQFSTPTSKRGDEIR